MVGTRSGQFYAWEFRPLTVAAVEGGIIDILLDTREDWVGRLTAGEEVEATLSDNRKNDWAHLSGTATVSTDPDLIDERWNPFASAFFEDGRDTPGIAVFRIRVATGRYWSSPSGRIGSLLSMVSAALGNDRGVGEHGTVTP